MSVFIEVESVEKQCKVIINLDEVLEIAPLREGGCALFFPDGAAVSGKASLKVKDILNSFKASLSNGARASGFKSRTARLLNTLSFNIFTNKLIAQSEKHNTKLYLVPDDNEV